MTFVMITSTISFVLRCLEYGDIITYRMLHINIVVAVKPDAIKVKSFCVRIILLRYLAQNTITYVIQCLHINFSLHWRHTDHDGVSNHQPHGCLLNRLFRRRSKGTSKLRVTGLCAGNSPVPVNSPHKGPVTRKMFPFDDVIMCFEWFT